MTNPLPIDCQFVAIWLTEEGLPFSATLRWHGEQLESYNYAIDDWDAECDHGFSVSFLKSVNALFFTDNPIKKTDVSTITTGIQMGQRTISATNAGYSND